MAGALESDFKPTRTELEHVGKGIGYSVPVEKAHCSVVDEARQSKAGQISRATRMHRIMTTLVSENMDRQAPEVKPCHVSEVSDLMIDEKIYECDDHVLSIATLEAAIKSRGFASLGLCSLGKNNYWITQGRTFASSFNTW